MGIDFPSGPTEGQTHQQEGQFWTFTNGAWVVGDLSGQAQRVSEKSGNSVVIGQTLICWGQRTGSGAVTFAKQFASEPDIALSMNATSAYNKHSTVHTLTVTGCNVVSQTSANQETANTIRYIAIGDARAEDVNQEVVAAGGGSGGAGNATVGDTLPQNPTEADMHYLTVQPVGLYMYVDNQWVQTNGGNSEAITRQGVNFRASRAEFAADYTWVNGNGTIVHVPFDTSVDYGEPFGSWSGGRFTVDEAGTYRIVYNTRPNCTQMDGARVRGWFCPAINDGTINVALQDFYLRNLSGSNTNFTFGAAGNEVIWDAAAGDFFSLRGMMVKESGSGVTVGCSVHKTGSHLTIEKVT